MNNANDSASHCGMQNFYTTLKSFVEANQTLPPAECYYDHPLRHKVAEALLEEFLRQPKREFLKRGLNPRKDFSMLVDRAHCEATAILRGLSVDDDGNRTFNGADVDEHKEHLFEMENMYDADSRSRGFSPDPFSVAFQKTVIAILLKKDEFPIEYTPPSRVAA